MLRAVLKKGRIHLVEPLPPEWREGTEVRIEKSSTAINGNAGESTDQWMDEVEALAAKTPAGEDDKLVAAVRQVRQEAPRWLVVARSPDRATCPDRRSPVRRGETFGQSPGTVRRPCHNKKKLARKGKR
jgi:hypothetical protein